MKLFRPLVNGDFFSLVLSRRCTISVATVHIIPSHSRHHAGYHAVTLSRLGIDPDEMDMSTANRAAWI